MRIAIAAVAALAACAGFASARGGRPDDRPNLLLILVDDLGTGDLSSYGASDLRTPAIDGLVSQGIRFDRFYANSPVCSPTRAALLTGRYQDLVGVPGVIRTDEENSWGRLSPDAELLPALLRRGGYQTAAVGKWHLGLEPPDTPNPRGFDFFHGFLGDMMDDYRSHRRHGLNYMRRDGREIDPRGHATDLFSEWAGGYLRRRATGGEPFFLYLAYNAPHTPIQPPEPWLAAVRAREPRISEQRARLVALIEHLDAGIGEVLSALEQAGLADRTLVVFASDNGGQLDVGASNGRLRLGKGTLYEGGIRVPAAARWPGRIAPGSRSDRVLLTMDVTPTLLEAASIEHEPLDGVSFLPTLLGEPTPEQRRDLFWGRREGPDRWFGKAGAVYAIRRGDWKLLRPRPDDPYQLFNLADDPFEEHDLAQAEPERLRELLSALERQLARYEQVPWRPPGRAGQRP